MELEPAMRGAIYSRLAGIPVNPFKNDPCWVPAWYADAWLDDVPLSSTTRQLIRRLQYERGEMICVSDLHLLRRRMPAEERLSLLKSLTRIPVQRLFLECGPGEVAAGVADYWRAGSRTGSMKPLIDSLGGSRGNRPLDVGYLLPRFCRDRLYRFPDPAAGADPANADCFWTALNFFRTMPDERFLNPDWRVQYVVDEFELVTGEPAFGDLIVFLDDGNRAIHGCVYVAGDVVFTKNGSSEFAPWVLMSYRDMLAYYLAERELSRLTYRKRSDSTS
jgi:hypothetical protein